MIRMPQKAWRLGDRPAVRQSRNPAERNVLGDYYLVDNPNRHIIVRDHIDLYEFAQEIGASDDGTLAQ